MSKRILLVEDSEDDQALTLRALSEAKVEADITIARDGAEALEYLFATGSFAGRNPDELPTVILLDLKLPKVDGLEVLDRIRTDERTKLVPVVILTSSAEESDLVKSYQGGASSYVRKPVDFDSFQNAVQQVGRYWLALNEPLPERWRG